MTKAERHALYTFLVVPGLAVVILTDAPASVAFTVLGLSVLALLWLVWVVLHDNDTLPPDLREGHEWDYLDRPDLMDRDKHGTARSPSGNAGD